MRLQLTLTAWAFVAFRNVVDATSDKKDGITQVLEATTSSSSSSSSNGWKNTKTFTALTRPLPLYPGEVTNTYHHLKIPKGPIAISEFAAEIVEINAEGEIVPVPLKDAYLHHHVVMSNPKTHALPKSHWWSRKSTTTRTTTIASRGIGFGAGTESRGTPQSFPFPYAFTTVPEEDELISNVHIINTRAMARDQARRCLECPCTLEDYNLTAYLPKPKATAEKTSASGWHLFGGGSRSHAASASILATAPEIPSSWLNNATSFWNSHKTNMTLSDHVMTRRSHWEKCNPPMLHDGNTGCFNHTYYGGLLCCEHGEFCQDDLYAVHHADQQDAKAYAKEQYQTLQAENKKNRHGQTASNKHNQTEEDLRIVYRLEHGDEDQSVYYLQYSLTYTELIPETQPLVLAACCDATGNMTNSGNVEYDIPQLCDETDDDWSSPKCVHTLETVQSLHGTSTSVFGTGSVKKDGEKDDNGGEWVNVVYMVGHLHRGGMEVSIYRNDTNELLCRSLPMYGTKNEIGNEAGYINAMSTCKFEDPPLRLKTTDALRIVAKYNATEPHTGVMSLFYIAMAPAEQETVHDEDSGFLKRFQPLAIFGAMVILGTALWKLGRRSFGTISRRWGYEQVSSNHHGVSLSV